MCNLRSVRPRDRYAKGGYAKGVHAKGVHAKGGPKGCALEECKGPNSETDECNHFGLNTSITVRSCSSRLPIH